MHWVCVQLTVSSFVLWMHGACWNRPAINFNGYFVTHIANTSEEEYEIMYVIRKVLFLWLISREVCSETYNSNHFGRRLLIRSLPIECRSQVYFVYCFDECMFYVTWLKTEYISEPGVYIWNQVFSVTVFKISDIIKRYTTLKICHYESVFIISVLRNVQLFHLVMTSE